MLMKMRKDERIRKRKRDPKGEEEGKRRIKRESEGKKNNQIK